MDERLRHRIDSTRVGVAAVVARARRTLGFTFAGRRHRYLHHDYNRTQTNERSVEIPIAAAELERHAGGRVLEVGNVLSHYLPVAHEVVDKYESAAGVANVDVVEHRGGPYDLILSVSTLEHVGWDEDVRDEHKALRAIEHLAGLLAPGGELFVTFPLGHNHPLDAQLFAGELGFDETRFLRRVSAANTWREVGPDDARGASYGAPYEWGNMIAVGRPRRSST